MDTDKNRKLRSLIYEKELEDLDSKLLRFTLDYVSKKVDIVKLVDNNVIKGLRAGIDKNKPNQYAIYDCINTILSERDHYDEALFLQLIIPDFVFLM